MPGATRLPRNVIAVDFSRKQRLSNDRQMMPANLFSICIDENSLDPEAFNRALLSYRPNQSKGGQVK